MDEPNEVHKVPNAREQELGREFKKEMRVLVALTDQDAYTISMLFMDMLRKYRQELEE